MYRLLFALVVLSASSARADFLYLPTQQIGTPPTIFMGFPFYNGGGVSLNSYLFSFAQFDPSLGQLTGVSLGIDSLLAINTTFTAQPGFHGNGELDAVVSLETSGPNRWRTAGSGTHIIDYGPAPSSTIRYVSAFAGGTLTSNLGAFIGDGSWNALADPFFIHEFHYFDPGIGVSSALSIYDISGTVGYEYTPSAQISTNPEPSFFALIGLAIAGMALLNHKRRVATIGKNDAA